MILYVGWDGSFVLSKHKLYKLRDDGGNYYLSPKAKGAKCLDVHDGRLCFGSLKLQMFEVVRLRMVRL